MSVVRTEDKYLCDACGVEYIGPPNLFDNRLKNDLKRTVCVAVFDHDSNRTIGTRLYLCAACSDAVLVLIGKMEPQKKKKKWWNVKGDAK